MKYKLILIISIISLNLNGQGNIYQIENLKIEIPNFFKVIDNERIEELAKQQNSELLDSLYKEISLTFDERYIFIYKNKECNCINNLVISAEKDDEILSNKELFNDTEYIQHYISQLKIIQEDYLQQYQKSDLSNTLEMSLPTNEIIKINEIFFIKISNKLNFENKKKIFNGYLLLDSGFRYSIEFIIDNENENVLTKIKNNLLTSLKLQINSK